MNVTIGNTVLNYKTNKDKYIITYIGESYNVDLDAYLELVFNSIFPYYTSNKLAYANVCGANAEFICNNLIMVGLTPGKIIISSRNWVEKNDEILEIIASVYGPIGITIGASYHALAYLEVIIEETKYYIAIETTSCIPYKLQFYVGSNEYEFETIIHTRYQCNDFTISFDCKKVGLVLHLDIKAEKNEKQKIKNKDKQPEEEKNLQTEEEKNVQRCKILSYSKLYIYKK